MSEHMILVDFVIPARLASSRLQNKMLLSETGKPLIQHTYEAVRTIADSKHDGWSGDLVVVATDSHEIADVIKKIGGRVVMTGPHPNGTSRVMEAIEETWRNIPSRNFCVNVQGDEPLISDNVIDTLIDACRQLYRLPPRRDLSPTGVATLATPISNRREHIDHNCVKVVTNAFGNAMYFSRAPIPYLDAISLKYESPICQFVVPAALRHIGVYAFHASTVKHYSSMKQTDLVTIESLEQLIWLANEVPVQVGIVNDHSRGIDTRADYEEFARIVKGLG